MTNIHHEGGSEMFFQNTGNHTQDYMVSQSNKMKMTFLTLYETRISNDTVDSYQLIKELLIIKLLTHRPN